MMKLLILMGAGVVFIIVMLSIPMPLLAMFDLLVLFSTGRFIEKGKSSLGWYLTRIGFKKTAQNWTEMMNIY